MDKGCRSPIRRRTLEAFMEENGMVPISLIATIPEGDETIILLPDRGFIRYFLGRDKETTRQILAKHPFLTEYQENEEIFIDPVTLHHVLEWALREGRSNECETLIRGYTSVVPLEHIDGTIVSILELYATRNTDKEYLSYRYLFEAMAGIEILLSLHYDPAEDVARWQDPRSMYMNIGDWKRDGVIDVGTECYRAMRAYIRNEV